MIRPSSLPILAALLALGASAAAQTPLSLPDAIARARVRHPDAGMSASAEREARQRVTEARAAYLPKVDAAAAWQRSDQPVFVFGSLLGQRRFTAERFDIDALNQPAAIDNVRTALTVEQPIFDAAARARLSAARLSSDLATTDRRMVDIDLAARVTDAYGRVLLADASSRVAVAAVETALADRDLSVNRRDAGRATDADVLQIDLYLSRARAQQIRASADDRVARAALNELMGEPLDARFTLDPIPALPAAPAFDPAVSASLETEALANRPDVRRAALGVELSDAAVRSARAAFLPQISAQGAWEANGGAEDPLRSSWAVGITARINLFNGFADKARVAAAREAAARAALEQTHTERTARLSVYAAVEQLGAARAADLVGRAAIAQAAEARRIVRDRYEAGLADVAALVRAAEAVTAADAEAAEARVGVLIAAAELQRALGRP